jgi:hypothetical protein
VKRFDASAVNCIKTPGPFGTGRGEACRLEYSEVLRNRWPCYIQPVGEFPN